MATMNDIDKAASDYAIAHDALRQIVARIDADRAEVMKKYLGKLRTAVKCASDKKTVLRSLIDNNRELFVKPKTRVLHEVKVGLVKGKGKIVIDDPDKTVKLIEKHYSDKPEMIEQLIEVTKTPRKDGLNCLEGIELRKLGVTIVAAGEQIVIKPTAGDVDKLVDALLQDDEAEAA